MGTYIDGFVFPVKTDSLKAYQKVAMAVADIWQEHGALAYQEFVADNQHLSGTLAFHKALAAKENETVVFGWVVFASREARDLANAKVAEGPRMAELVGPLVKGPDPIFDASRMAYGGFKSLVELPA